MQPRKTPWQWIVPTALMLFLVFALGLGFIGLAMNGGDAAAGPRVGLVELSGPITDGGTGSAFSRVPGARDVIEDLERAGRDKTIEAVVLRINSPGGSPAASQEMYRAVKKLAADKPVVCSMGDVAASGGYYVAAACDEIYANESTITGSIGVITQLLNYGALAKKLGLDTQTLKSGEFKDAGNPSRPLTPRERQLFQALIRDIYNQFVDDVAAGRKDRTGKDKAGKAITPKLTRAKIIELADGRVYTGRQALANGLVDKLGGLREAVEAAAQKGGITGDAKVKNLSGGGTLGSLLSAESSIDKNFAGAASSIGASAGDAAGRAFIERLKQESQADAGSLAPQMR